MAVNWTDEQKKVIDLRGRNILVSAAAGSGKTAVLVARIMSRILDAEDPVNIDELLIVTFTRAAAGEMRERLMDAILKEREKRGEDTHLARQLALLSNAQITTIDGFCSYVVRSYGHRIGLSPGSRIAESGESALIKEDALQDVLEGAYAREDPEFRERMTVFAETFAWGKSEKQVESAILRVAETAESSPDPEAFLEKCMESAGVGDARELFGLEWMREYMNDALRAAKTALREARANVELALLPEGPSAYLPTARAEEELFEGICRLSLRTPEEYDACRKLLTEFQAVPLSKKRPAAGELPELRERFKQRRGEIDRIRKELLSAYFPGPAEDIAFFIRKSEEPIRTLLLLVRDFRARCREIKEARRVMDFSDLEHFALAILTCPEGRSEAARELSGRFREIMIDEYQDSNYLQEAILQAVSRCGEGEQNYFSVGDVKQSIYSFRQARPELFMEKFRRFHEDPEEGECIGLHRNFRSRPEVIRTVNGIFRGIMRSEIGGVRYDEEACLVQGASYPEAEGMESELLVLLTKEKEEEAVFDKIGSREAREMEARMIGGRIREIVGHLEIYDRREDRTRPAQYRDIVILLRTMEGWADVFAEVLKGMRIPAFSTAKSGYFSAPEVTALLNYLSILDNPQQEIPFASVLKSAFVGLDLEQLTRIRTADLGVSLSGSTKRGDVSLYEAARGYAEAGEEDQALRNRLQDFFALYDRLREAAPDTPLHELINTLLTVSGYLEYVSALPGGAQRALNLRMLADKALEYEETSYVGLFSFIRYIENLKKYSQDFGEISAVSERDDVVRIYSIHRSKGLEYPIVFAAGLGKAYNMQDLNTDLLIHPEMGVAAAYLDYVRRTKAPSLHRQAIRARLLRDSLGEELRVLYVALTRAQQKLIMTGCFPDEQKKEELSALTAEEDGALPVSYIEKCKNAMQLLLPAAELANRAAERAGEASVTEIRLLKPTDLAEEEVQRNLRREELLTELKSLRSAEVYDEEMREVIERRFSYVYPYPEAQIPVELSVSDLKKEAMQGAADPLLAGAAESGSGEAVQSIYPEETVSPLVPSFYEALSGGEEKGMAGEDKKYLGGERAAPPLTGALRGTAYHRVCELLPLRRFRGLSMEETVSKVRETMEQMTGKGLLTEEEAGSVSPEDLCAFLTSSLGQRMAAADERKELFREQPFVLGMDASSIKEEWPEGEIIFVQGIIDAFFYEGGGEEETSASGDGKYLVLVDYKTDRVGTGEELIRRYQVQLDSYAEALSRVTGCPVREKRIWSFTLGLEIAL